MSYLLPDKGVEPFQYACRAYVRAVTPIGCISGYVIREKRFTRATITLIPHLFAGARDSNSLYGFPRAITFLRSTHLSIDSPRIELESNGYQPFALPLSYESVGLSGIEPELFRL